MSGKVNLRDLEAAIDALGVKGIVVQRLDDQRARVQCSFAAVFGISAQEATNAATLKEKARAFLQTQQPRLQRLPEAQQTAFVTFLRSRLRERFAATAPEPSDTRGRMPAQERGTPTSHAHSAPRAKSSRVKALLLTGAAAAATALGVAGYALRTAEEKREGQPEPGTGQVARKDAPPQSPTTKRADSPASTPRPPDASAAFGEAPPQDAPSDPPQPGSTPHESPTVPLEAPPAPSGIPMPAVTNSANPPPPAVPAPEPEPEPTPAGEPAKPAQHPVEGPQPPPPAPRPDESDKPVQEMGKEALPERIETLRQQLISKGFYLAKVHPDFYEGKGVFAPNHHELPWVLTTVRMSHLCEVFRGPDDGFHCFLPTPQLLGSQIPLGTKLTVEVNGKPLDPSKYKTHFAQFPQPSGADKKPCLTYCFLILIPKEFLQGMKDAKDLVIHGDTALLVRSGGGLDQAAQQRETLRWFSKLTLPLPPYTLPPFLAQLPPARQQTFRAAQRARTFSQRFLIGTRAAANLPYEKDAGFGEPGERALLQAIKGNCATKAALAMEIIQSPGAVTMFNGFCADDGELRAISSDHSCLGVVADGQAFVYDTTFNGAPVWPVCDHMIVTSVGVRSGCACDSGSEHHLIRMHKKPYLSAPRRNGTAAVGPYSTVIPALHEDKDIAALAKLFAQARRDLPAKKAKK